MNNHGDILFEIRNYVQFLNAKEVNFICKNFVSINDKVVLKVEFSIIQLKYGKVELWHDGFIVWKNSLGQYHNELGPAIKRPDSPDHYYINGIVRE